MDDSVWAIIAALGIDIFLFTLEFYLFSIYRKIRNRPIFAEIGEREVKVPVYSESDTPLWVLMTNVWKVPYEEMGHYCGIEGQLYLAFHVAMGGGLAVLAVIGCGLLIPIYALGDTHVKKDMNNISIAHIIEQEDLMSIVLILFLVFTIIIFGTLVGYLYQVSYAHSTPSELICTIDRYTIQIKGISKAFTPDVAAQKIRDFLQMRYGYDIQSIYVVPDLAEASRLQKELEEAKKNQKHYMDFLIAKGYKEKIKPTFCGKEVDAIDYYTCEIGKLEKEYKEALENGKNITSGFAFVICKTPISTFNIIKTFKGEDDELQSNKWILTLAPAPAEVNWPNMSIHKPRLWIKRAGLFILFFIFFFLLITPSTLLQIMMYILEWIGGKELYEALLSQVAPSLILLIYQSAIVRHAVLAIVEREQLPSKSDETVSAMIKYLLVMVTYTFLVPLLGVQVYSAIVTTVDGESDWDQEIANHAAYSAQVFTIFVIHLIFLKNGGDFLQVPKLVRVKWRQMKAVNDTERMLAYEAYEFRWAYEYGVSISAIFIIFAFSIAYPLILIIGVFFCISRYYTAKYNLLCFYCTVKTTTGNRIPRVIVVALLVSILFFQLTTAYLLLLSDSMVYVYISGGLIIVSIFIFLVIYYMRNEIEKELKKSFGIEQVEEEGLIFGSDISNYYHPLQDPDDAHPAEPIE
ncbi:TMEM63A_2 [Blepharisma stoltei]|uniref:Uncharacterized protein n=1 Tax=Blepharisma stoltei TaxID=1481888 RepID=A0AAU9K5N2_9CILI|nr:unnamed protein product [Blepharisma stoltei]